MALILAYWSLSTDLFGLEFGYSLKTGLTANALYVFMYSKLIRKNGWVENFPGYRTESFQQYKKSGSKCLDTVGYYLRINNCTQLLGHPAYAHLCFIFK